MKFLIVVGYSIVCALLLALFSHIEDLFKYIFSLGALFTGIQFFKRHEGRGMRIAFVVTTIVLYFLFAVIYAFYLAMKTVQLPAAS
ncbi:hypothetical protein N0M98_04860 [Paenibacillus doosanensis]|uniref:DUF3953 domain-containing protein n=1 Tax=Paenibacillus konkukensis TaxID=2020716 RepID=A0ABY4RYL7_9BACL|nr:MULTISPECIES: hypothetical protein [Paenibacillus]MCS7459463.1 hypothetical protein [Paenibacillus doosanensis]UQZ87257.1 hypothetical protein SK3146_06554 [Paenibacillus konkukensis]